MMFSLLGDASLRFFLATVLLLIVFSSKASDYELGVFNKEQIWEGSYLCGNNKGTLKLGITHKANGRFFGIVDYVAATGASGKYKVKGTIFSTDNIRVEPMGDIVMASGYVAIGFNFALSNDGQVLKGNAAHPGCSTAELKRSSEGIVEIDPKELVARGLAKKIEYNSKEYAPYIDDNSLDIKGLRVGQALDDYLSVLDGLGFKSDTLGYLNVLVHAVSGVSLAKASGKPYVQEKLSPTSDVLETYFGAGSNQYEVLLKLNDKNQKLKLTIDRVSGQLVSVAFIDPRQVDCNVADKAFTAKYGREPSPQDYLDLLDAQYEYGVIEEPSVV